MSTMGPYLAEDHHDAGPSNIKTRKPVRKLGMFVSNPDPEDAGAVPPPYLPPSAMTQSPLYPPPPPPLSLPQNQHLHSPRDHSPHPLQTNHSSSPRHTPYVTSTSGSSSRSSPALDTTPPPVTPSHGAPPINIAAGEAGEFGLKPREDSRVFQFDNATLARSSLGLHHHQRFPSDTLSQQSIPVSEFLVAPTLPPSSSPNLVTFLINTFSLRICLSRCCFQSLTLLRVPCRSTEFPYFAIRRARQDRIRQGIHHCYSRW
ncbi:hypothetical protein BOTBODRAFT_310411 [Botryobasidium botryosum FD-172 SS1]|uniref:Uncharacterized protein n=1 Tax=Botryobasidium botryosum (strain FD-172 SS1) TaxID=930990 RepID=A0A067MXP5_BOTB1|nr:hypothetical protein BOTBODRAFT_310411 [Botryobasidium botryosum FD-172 SS1]